MEKDGFFAIAQNDTVKVMLYVCHAEQREESVPCVIPKTCGEDYSGKRQRVISAGNVVQAMTVRWVTR